MTYEEMLLRKYHRMLYDRMHKFCAKSFLPVSVYGDDIMQECAIAFLTWVRANDVRVPELSERDLQNVARFIDLYLLTAFQDTEGIGLRRNMRKQFYKRDGGLRFVPSEDDLIDSEKSECTAQAAVIDEDDTLYAVCLREWLKSLAEIDRKVACDMMIGYTNADVCRRRNLSRQNMRTRVKNMRKSFRDYVQTAV